MAEGENKRVVKKKNNGDVMNIKVSTQDKTILSKDKEIDFKIEGQKKSRNNTNIKTSITKKSSNQEKDEKSIENRITKISESNKNLQNEIESLQSLLNSESEKEVAEISSLNKNLSQLTKTQIKLSNENKKILNNFKGLEDMVSKKFNKNFKETKVLANLKKNNSNNINNAEKEIKVKESQMKNVEKSINYNKKEIKRLNDLLTKNNEGSEEELKKELEELNNKSKELEKEIEVLNKIKHEQKLCDNTHKTLKSNLNIISNEIEFESKRKNMIKIEKKEPTKIKNVSMTMDYGENIRKKMLENVKIKYNSKIKLVNFKSYNFLIKESNENRNKTIQTSENIERFNSSSGSKHKVHHRIDTENPKEYLFSEQDKEVLQKLIPKKYYNNYNEKFIKAENEINEIKENFKDHGQIKKEMNIFSIKNDTVNFALKELAHKKTQLSIKASKNEKIISKLNKDIKNLNEQLEKVKVKSLKLEKNKKDLQKKLDDFPIKNTKEILLQTDL